VAVVIAEVETDRELLVARLAVEDVEALVRK